MRAHRKIAELERAAAAHCATAVADAAARRAEAPAQRRVRTGGTRTCRASKRQQRKPQRRSKPRQPAKRKLRRRRPQSRRKPKRAAKTGASKRSRAGDARKPLHEDAVGEDRAMKEALICGGPLDHQHRRCGLRTPRRRRSHAAAEARRRPARRCAKSTTSTTAPPRSEEVWRDGKVVLYRFVGEQAPTAKVPLLIAYALVNRPYMVDLQADNRSLVKGLLARGEDVYIIDWGYPDRSDRFLMLDDYIDRFLGGAVDHLRAQLRPGCDQPARHLPGRRVLAVLRVAASGARCSNLITMVTPVDFHTAGQHAVELDPRHGRGPVRRHARQRAGRPDELRAT